MSILRAQIPKLRAESTKKTDGLTVFCAFGICARKSCSLNVDEIEPVEQLLVILFAVLSCEVLITLELKNVKKVQSQFFVAYFLYVFFLSCQCFELN
jgi:hypothetical protein